MVNHYQSPAFYSGDISIHGTLALIPRVSPEWKVNHCRENRGRGYSWEFLVGVCRSVLQILPRFQTKKCNYQQQVVGDLNQGVLHDISRNVHPIQGNGYCGMNGHTLYLIIRQPSILKPGNFRKTVSVGNENIN